MLGLYHFISFHVLSGSVLTQREIVWVLSTFQKTLKAFWTNKGSDMVDARLLTRQLTHYWLSHKWRSSYILSRHFLFLMTSRSGCLYQIHVYFLYSIDAPYKVAKNFLNSSSTLAYWGTLAVYSSFRSLRGRFGVWIMKRDRGFVNQHKVSCSKRFVFSDMSLILFNSKLNLAANSVYYYKENDNIVSIRRKGIHCTLLANIYSDSYSRNIRGTGIKLIFNRLIYQTRCRPEISINGLKLSLTRGSTQWLRELFQSVLSH